jgi:hypothetical protein
MTEENVPQGPEGLPPYKIAFVVDGEVADILHTDERLFAIFMSNPVIVDVTQQITANPQSIPVGSLYDVSSNTFSILGENTNEEPNV